MASKRKTHEEGNDENDRQAPGKRTFTHSEQPQTLYPYSSGGSSNSTNEIFLSQIEKKLQEIVPPMIEKAVRASSLQPHPSLCFSCGLSLKPQRIGPSGGGKTLQLCFMNKLRPKIFTQTKITAEDGSPLQIALCETSSFQQRRVKEDASSVRVQLCVLKGDFGSNGSDDWNPDEFKANILCPREGKGPLLYGQTFVTLKNGVGYVKHNLVFTDNSAWTRSGRFRIGLKVCESTSNGAEIKEGRSEPLRVMDKRGEAYEKRDRPSLDDDVWRLHKIAKNGKIRKQLSLHGIKTVKDMLRRYTIDEASLKQDIGNIQRRSWDTIIEHARACEIDNDERYSYMYVAAGKSVSLVFNCIYEVVQVSFNGQIPCSLESLSSDEERLVEIVKKQAYSNLKDLKPFEATPHSLVSNTFTTMPYVAPDQVLQQFPLPITQQDPFIYNLTGQEAACPNLCQPSSATTTSFIDEAALSDQACSSELPDQFPYLDDIEWSQNFGFSPNCYSFTPPTSSFTPPTSNLSSREKPDPLYTPYCGYEPESSKPVGTSTNGKVKTIWRKFRYVRIFLKCVAEFAVQRKTKVFHCED